MAVKENATKNTCVQYFRLNKNTNEMEIKWKRLCSFYKLVLIPKELREKAPLRKGRRERISGMFLIHVVKFVLFTCPHTSPSQPLLSHVRPLGLVCFIIPIHYYHLVLLHTKILLLADKYQFVHSAVIY